MEINEIKKVEIKRNPKWPPLDWKAITKECGDISKYDEKMCENQCETTEIAIIAIKRRRESDRLYQELEIEATRQKRRDRFIRTHYNDLEADNFERQEQRMLNG